MDPNATSTYRPPSRRWHRPGWAAGCMEGRARASRASLSLTGQASRLRAHGLAAGRGDTLCVPRSSYRLHPAQPDAHLLSRIDPGDEADAMLQALDLLQFEQEALLDLERERL